MIEAGAEMGGGMKVAGTSVSQRGSCHKCLLLSALLCCVDNVILTHDTDTPLALP